MSREFGHPKTGGRKKGQLNRKTVTLIEKCEELEVDPFEILLLFAKGDWKSLGYDSPTRVKMVGEGGHEVLEDTISPELRGQCAKEACHYIHPKRKAIEHSGEITNPYLVMSLSELESEVQKRMKK